MALKVLHTSGTPLGEYDAKDADLTGGFLGGEVVTWGTVAIGNTDKSAADSADGYVNPNLRPYLTRTISSSTRALMLVDDGLSGYGVLFGVVTGGTAGQTSFGPGGGSPLGPASYVASGKLSVWATPGLFGVTLDAVDTAASTGVQPTNSACIPGAALFTTITGVLCLSGGSPAQTLFSVGRFVDFETNRSLVTTPNRLVAALNSPSSTVSGTLPSQLTMAVFNFWPGAV